MSAILLSVLMRLSGENESWSGTQTQLAAECGVCRRTLIRWLNAARDAQSITVVGKAGCRLTYAVSTVARPTPAVEPARPRRRSNRAAALAIMGAVFGTIMGVGQSIRRGKKKDAVGQTYLDFEADWPNTVAKREKTIARLEKEMPAPQECERRLRSIGSTETPLRESAVSGGETSFLPGGSYPTTRRKPLTKPSLSSRSQTFPFPDFILPAKTNHDDLRNPAWVETHVYAQGLRLGVVNESEFKHCFAIVGRVLRSEQKTPAALLTFILRGGTRKMPWRGDLAAVDWRFADDMISRLSPKPPVACSGVTVTGERHAETEETRADNFEANRTRWKNHLSQLIGSNR